MTRQNGSSGVRAAKIIDVAKLAGVSTATVSRALNQPETVAESTRQSVIEAAAKTGYRINIAARNLRRQRAGAVVVLVPHLENPFFSEILSGIEAALAKTGLSVLIADTKHPGVPSSLVFDYLHSGRADGVISLDGSLADILADAPHVRDALPPIVYACEWIDNDASPSVRVDNAAGAALAISHLADLGHTRIGHIRGPTDNILTRERSDGATGELRARGLDVRADWFFDGDFTMAGGRRAARRWMALEDRPTAMFCASDETAIGFISTLHDAGLSVPGDVSVVGFDDIEIAGYFIPPLTTVRQPRTALGATAANLLIDLVEGDGTEKTDDQKVLPVELIVRSSTVGVSGMARRGAP
jgi:LacI family repressor for deo operon, udp, cdd, tsx, nupC, and nupG